MRFMLTGIFTVSTVCSALTMSAAYADSLAEMQKKLNEETMARPFSVEEEATLKAYVDDAMKKNIAPPEYKGRHWKKGYTCGNLRRYYNEYRDCLWYHRYHGRYYW